MSGVLPSHVARGTDGRAYDAFTAIGPLRESDLDAPLRDTDFCPCTRGRVALAWHHEGLTVLPTLAELAGECDACEATTGLLYWRGWYTSDGVMIFAWRLPVAREGVHRLANAGMHIHAPPKRTEGA